METLVNNACANIEERQISFAWKSGLILFLGLALFIGLGIYLFGGSS